MRFFALMRFILAVLEGGYDLAATARIAVRTVGVMMGDPAPARPQEPADALIRGIISRVRSAARKTDWGKGVQWGVGPLPQSE